MDLVAGTDGAPGRDEDTLKRYVVAWCGPSTAHVPRPQARAVAASFTVCSPFGGCPRWLN